jgi:hypothetical protein
MAAGENKEFLMGKRRNKIRFLRVLIFIKGRAMGGAIFNPEMKRTFLETRKDIKNKGCDIACLTDAWDQGGRVGRIFGGQEGMVLFGSSRWTDGWMDQARLSVFFEGG